MAMVLREDDQTRSEITTGVKQRGGKNGKVTRKKTPQRGLGVEKLERLRLQERWKLMTEIDQSEISPNLQTPFAFQFPISYYDPKNRSSPLPFNGFSPVNYLPEGQTSTFGFSPYRFNNGGYDHTGVLPFETSSSKELSSIQTVHCLYDHCEICFEKKGSSESSLGLSLGGGGSSVGHMEEEGVEVMAVHRKRNGVKGGESVLMEYEFFPSSSSSNGNKDSSSSVSVSEMAAVDEASPSPSSFLDLSLKLSCYT